MRAELTQEIKDEARRQLAQEGASSLSLRAIARQLGMVSLDLCPPMKKKFGRLMAMESIQWLTN